MRYKHSQSGFSLVETLVAISLLLIIIVGPMTISSSATQSTSFATEQVVAFFLAQEGAEIAQRARDDLILENLENASNGGWDEFTDEFGTFEGCFESDGCALELNTNATGSLRPVLECEDESIGGTEVNCRLNFDSSNNRAQYNYQDLGDETPYTRIIRFENITADEVRVQSEVFWRTGSQREAQRVEVVTYLFNVYDR